MHYRCTADLAHRVWRRYARDTFDSPAMQARCIAHPELRCIRHSAWLRGDRRVPTCEYFAKRERLPPEALRCIDDHVH